MVNAKDFFSGNFIKAEDCKGGEICEILKDASIDEIRTKEGKTKSVMNFQVKINDKEKTFTPNITNGNIMVEAWGDGTEKWVGKKFKITLIKATAFGKVIDSILVEPMDVAKEEAVK